ncbi:MAG: hypothetical protein IJ165_10710 [Proteobacteria bacterium]|nr:hypothetical protein [Pseudomonadota bacterium]
MKHKFLWMVSLGLACTFAACGGDDPDPEDQPKEPSKPQVVENTMPLCSDGIDNDDNGKADCDDEGCGGFVFCKSDDPTKENTPKNCADGKDNDGDGDMDCADAQCKSFTICKEAEPENTEAACKDGLDNDKDSKKDCDDSDCEAFCKSDPGPGPEPGSVENTDALCHDSQDNDGDGKIDCDDSDCSAFCTPDPGPTDKVENTPELCSDKQDNDGDGKADCLDTDCQGFDICKAGEGVKENTRELCTDGLDNDGNGAADCDDKNCKTLLVCTSGGKSGENSPALCANGMDDDGDSLSDCADPECHYFEICQGKTATGENSEAACKDGRDNDNDGYIDCADAECQGFSSCSDACPDDPFKFVDDQCGCGKTLIDGECYINIVDAEGLKQLKDSSEKYVIKRPFNIGTSDMAPITGFKGTLFGDDMRIMGYLTQTAVTNPYSEGFQECGLFGSTDGTPTFKNINIAITLNCEDSTYSGMIKAGALVSSSKGTLTDIEGESKVMLISKKSDMKVASYKVLVGGIGGLLEGDLKNVEVTGNTSAEIEWTFDNDQTTEFHFNNIFIGGVAGYLGGNSVSNIQAPSNVTLDYKLTFKGEGWKHEIYAGGIAGKAVRLDKCSNIGGNILVQHGNEKNTDYSHYIGGIAGQAHRVTNSVFDGNLTSSGSAGNQAATDKYDSTLIGGIVGNLISATPDDTVVDGCYSHANMTLISGAGMYVGGLVGRMGHKPKAKETDSEKYYILNSYSDATLSVVAPKTAYDKTNFYWGGAVAQAAEYGYVLNSHLRSNYLFDEFSVAAPDGNHELSLGGITAKTDTDKDENGGQLIDNIVSGGPKVSEGSENAAKYQGSMAATFGYYIYETYWDGAVYGTKTQDATQSTKQDVTAMPYSYNASGVPVLSDSRTVLGLLRSNSGHDEGPMSAKLPPKLIYSDWKEISDSDGHKVPVPVSSWY